MFLSCSALIERTDNWLQLPTNTKKHQLRSVSHKMVECCFFIFSVISFPSVMNRRHMPGASQSELGVSGVLQLHSLTVFCCPVWRLFCIFLEYHRYCHGLRANQQTDLVPISLMSWLVGIQILLSWSMALRSNVSVDLLTDAALTVCLLISLQNPWGQTVTVNYSQKPFLFCSLSKLLCGGGVNAGEGVITRRRGKFTKPSLCCPVNKLRRTFHYIVIDCA